MLSFNNVPRGITEVADFNSSVFSRTVKYFQRLKESLPPPP